MSDVVMKEEDSNTLSVKELDVVLPRYQPFNGYTSPLDFILPPYQEFYGPSNVWEPPPQDLFIKETEAELENLHLPSSEEVGRRSLVTTEEEEKKESGFDILSVDELFKGNMPDWLPGDSKLQYYEMKESEVEQAKEWLHLYAELAWYTKKQTDPFMFEYAKPFELRKIIVETKEVVDSMKNLKLDNAVFYISFRTRCGVVCKGIIRRTMDGRPENLSLEAKCFC
ncbi:hypothetical protein N665_0830s0025 [Sinapis alba]|nr:hypothetical protein N665_0830s0025 [Sinapis alba]